MNFSELNAGLRIRRGYVLAGLICAIPIACALGITSYFRLSSDPNALRRSVMGSVSGNWKTKFTLSIGWLTTEAVRSCVRSVKLPAEPRAALNAIRGVEVGVYKLQHQPRPADYMAVLAAGDKAMMARGWERIVGVVERDQCVAVYIPRKGFSPKRINCCVLVLQETDLVVVSARANVKPLMELASKQISQKLPFRRDS